MADQKQIVQSTGWLNLLGIAFIVLKLCGVINWSWWYVLLPFYGLLGLLAIGAVVIFVIYLFTRDGSSH